MNTIDARTLANASPWIVRLGALCLAFAALSASAAPPVENRRVTVNFADLDIDDQAGTKVLYQRIQSAARSVCGPMDSPFFPARQAARKCYEEAITNAVSQVDSETLTALHRSKWKGLSLG